LNEIPVRGGTYQASRLGTFRSWSIVSSTKPASFVVKRDSGVGWLNVDVCLGCESSAWQLSQPDSLHPVPIDTW